jgi:hypothetical protein
MIWGSRADELENEVIKKLILMIKILYAFCSNGNVLASYLCDCLVNIYVELEFSTGGI